MPGIYLATQDGAPVTNTNRLPVSIDVESITAGNIVIVDGVDSAKKVTVQDNALFTKITGSNVLVKESLTLSGFIAFGIKQYYGATMTGGGVSTLAAAVPLNVTDYRNRQIVLINNTNTPVFLSAYAHSSLIAGSNMYEVIAELSVAVGATKVFDLADYPLLDSPFVGLSVALRATSAAGTGSVNIWVLGGRN